MIILILILYTHIIDNLTPKDIDNMINAEIITLIYGILEKLQIDYSIS